MAPSAPPAASVRGSAGLVPLAGRRVTDPLFLLLFVACSLGPQLFLAGHAVKSGLQSGWEASAELPDHFFQGIACSMVFSALTGLVGLQLLRCVPIRLAVYGGLGGGIAALFALGVAVSCGLLDDGEDPLPLNSASGAVAKIISARGGELLILAALAAVALVGWFWKEIQLSVAVLRSTACFLGDAAWVPTLFPLLFGLAHLAGLCLWGLAVLGAIQLVKEEEGLGKNLRERYFVQSGLALLLCYFWGNGLVTALSSFATATATAEWYFARGPEKRQAARPERILEIVKLGLWKHGGSMALGSLLLAALRLLNLCLFWAGRNHTRRGEDPCLRRWALRLREGAAALLEAFAKFASRQAYVEVAVSGCGFFAGAAEASRRAARAPKRFVAVEGASAVQRAFSQVLLVAVVGCAAAVLYAADPAEGEAAEASAASGGAHFAVAVHCFGAWLVAESILHPVSVATSTVLHCLLLDGGVADASHAPLPLRQLMQAKTEEETSFAKHYA